MKCLPPITSAALAVLSGRRAFAFSVLAAQVGVLHARASRYCLGVIALLTELRLDGQSSFVQIPLPWSVFWHSLYFALACSRQESLLLL